MILDMIIEKKRITLEEELIRVPSRKQGKIIKQMKLYDLLFVIGGIRKASPNRGVIVENFDAACFANVHDEAGINTVSVLVEHSFFQGNLENIEIVHSVNDLPILRKDLIIDAREVVQTKHIGANMILLIMAMLDDATLCGFYRLTRFLDLECIVEVHNEKELEQTLQPRPEIIGISNRDLHTFAVSLKTTKCLVFRIPVDISIVPESGASIHEDVEYVRKTGADAVLIGESFMRCPDTRTHLQELKHGSYKTVRC